VERAAVEYPENQQRQGAGRKPILSRHSLYMPTRDDNVKSLTPEVHPRARHSC
jgi:hypothetical protein